MRGTIFFVLELEFHQIFSIQAVGVWVLQ